MPSSGIFKGEIKGSSFLQIIRKNQKLYRKPFLKDSFSNKRPVCVFCSQKRWPFSLTKKSFNSKKSKIINLRMVIYEKLSIAALSDLQFMVCSYRVKQIWLPLSYGLKIDSARLLASHVGSVRFKHNPIPKLEKVTEKSA